LLIRVAHLWHTVPLIPVLLGCGARTGLDFDALRGTSAASDGGRDRSEAAPDVFEGGPDGSTGLPNACPLCPTNHVCSGPWACVEADGCTYGWCDSRGFGENSQLCGSDVAPSGWCATQNESYECENERGDQPPGVLTSHCFWPPINGNKQICNYVATSGDQSCGEVFCGPGCTCLCENFCWCGG
jgi:hypothetical protein